MNVTIVVPCYNESKRLQQNVFIEFLNKNPHIQILFVNDGSADNTWEILQKLSAHNQINCIQSDINKGKAEAVRLGMLFANKNLKTDYIGYWDADLATPLEEILNLLYILKDKIHIEIIMGLRLLRLGANVKRTKKRHILGRFFATFASLVLGISVYDTQCGAKIFKSNVVYQLFKNQFITKWLFDVEILARYIKDYGKIKAQSSIYELPLLSWEEVGGSKVKAKDFLKAPLELIKIYNAYLKK